MNPKTPTAKEDLSRLPSKRAKWVMRVFVRGLFASVMIPTVFVANMAIAAITPDEFGGRWQAKEHNLTLDVSRCANGWCGVEVTNGTLCGRTVLRLDTGKQGNNNVQFSGRLQLVAGTQHYGVQADLYRSGDALALTMLGHTGDVFHTAARTFNFKDIFARIGDPVCRPDAKVS